MSEVLVIGAAGKTGRAVTAALIRRGINVRAAVRPGGRTAVHQPDTSGPAPSVSLVAVDLTTGQGLDAAVDGVDGVYHLAPNVHPDEVGMAVRMGADAAAAGVERFAFHSVLHPDDDSMPHHTRKGLAEQAIRALLPQATVLRPAAYHQNLLGAAVKGRIAVPYDVEAPFTNVDLGDVAEVAALVLTQQGHEGAIYDLVGSEVLSVRQSARVASDVLGREVVAERITTDEWLRGPGADLAEQPRSDLLAMFAAYDRHGLVDTSPDLANLLGRTPTTWRHILDRDDSF